MNMYAQSDQAHTTPAPSSLRSVLGRGVAPTTMTSPSPRPSFMLASSLSHFSQRQQTTLPKASSTTTTQSTTRAKPRLRKSFSAAVSLRAQTMSRATSMAMKKMFSATLSTTPTLLLQQILRATTQAISIRLAQMRMMGPMISNSVKTLMNRAITRYRPKRIRMQLQYLMLFSDPALLLRKKMSWQSYAKPLKYRQLFLWQVYSTTNKGHTTATINVMKHRAKLKRSHGVSFLSTWNCIKAAQITAMNWYRQIWSKQLSGRAGMLRIKPTSVLVLVWKRGTHLQTRNSNRNHPRYTRLMMMMGQMDRMNRMSLLYCRNCTGDGCTQSPIQRLSTCWALASAKQLRFSILYSPRRGALKVAGSRAVDRQPWMNSSCRAMENSSNTTSMPSRTQTIMVIRANH